MVSSLKLELLSIQQKYSKRKHNRTALSQRQDLSPPSMMPSLTPDDPRPTLPSSSRTELLPPPDGLDSSLNSPSVPLLGPASPSSHKYLSRRGFLDDDD